MADPTPFHFSVPSDIATQQARRPPSGQWQWTAKLPALAIGILLIIGGFLFTRGRWRYSLPVGIGLLIVGVVLVIYSETVHGWCAPTTVKFNNMAFGQAYWHQPSAYDCVHLVYPYKG